MTPRLIRYVGRHDGAPAQVTFEVNGEPVTVARGDTIELDPREARALLAEPGAQDAEGADWEPVAREAP